MQDSLYPLGVKDIEAIGKSRVNRSISKNLRIWMYASLVVFAIGLFCAYTISVMPGMMVMIVGMVVLLVYTNTVDKTRKAMVKKLKLEWQEEGQDRGRADR